MSGHGNQDADYLNGRHEEVQPTAEQLLDGAQFVQHRGGGQYRTCAEWDASGVFIPLSRWFALQRRLSAASSVDTPEGGA